MTPEQQERLRQGFEAWWETLPLSDKLTFIGSLSRGRDVARLAYLAGSAASEALQADLERVTAERDGWHRRAVEAEKDAEKAFGWAGSWRRIVEAISTILELEPADTDPDIIAGAVRAKFEALASDQAAEIARLRAENARLRVAASRLAEQADHCFIANSSKSTRLSGEVVRLGELSIETRTALKGSTNE